MKILLINPPIPAVHYNTAGFGWYYLPTSLMYLSSALQKNGNNVKILDLKIFNPKNYDNPENFYTQLLIDTVLDFQPELIGVGCLYSGLFPEILKFSVSIKNKFKEIPIVIGGIHPTIYSAEILNNCSSIDWIVLGEGEEAIVQLVDTLKSKCYEFDKIDGFAYRKNGNAVVNPKINFIKDLDTIPFPAYDLINFKDYYIDTSDWYNPKKLPINTTIPIITSRSCPNRCTFCSMYIVMGQRWRARSPENVVDEIEYLYSKYGLRHFSFMDDNLTFRKTHILGICDQIIKRKLNIEFETPNGLSINTLDKEILDAMVSAGLVRISLAIESGSDSLRNKIMKKNLSREKIFEIVCLTKKYPNLFVNVFFIIGMPEETEETLMDTYNMIRDIDVDRVFIQNVLPFPGTRLFEQSLKDNLLIDIVPDDLYKSDALYLTNYNRFFIRPYKLDLKYLHEFRAKVDNLLNEKKSQQKEKECHLVN